MIQLQKSLYDTLLVLQLRNMVSFPLYPCVPESPTLGLFFFDILCHSPGTSNRQETEFQPMAKREQSPSVRSTLPNSSGSVLHSPRQLHQRQVGRSCLPNSHQISRPCGILEPKSFILMITCQCYHGHWQRRLPSHLRFEITE